MNRINEIDEFLRNISSYLKQNPNFELKESHVYEMLKRYDLTSEEYKKSFKDYFPYWEEYFKNKKNIIAFIHGSQKRFLQFWNINKDDSEYIKLYVNVNPDSMLKTVNEIFTFTAKKNIKQVSKVSDKARNDSIVLRIKEENAKKVIDFINNNRYIKKNAKKTNPFILREGIVGLAYDDNLSYNSTISYIISEYFKSKKMNNDLESTSSIDFYRYVYDYSRNLSNNEEFIKNFKNSEYFKLNYNRLFEYGMAKEDVLNNARRVIDLISFSLNDNKKYNDFTNMYVDSKNNKEENVKRHK